MPVAAGSRIPECRDFDFFLLSEADIRRLRRA